MARTLGRVRRAGLAMDLGMPSRNLLPAGTELANGRQLMIANGCRGIVMGGSFIDPRFHIEVLEICASALCRAIVFVLLPPVLRSGCMPH